MNQSLQSGKTSTNENLLADIACCFPTLYLEHYIEKVDSIDTGPYDKALVIWGEVLVTSWNMMHVGQWLVPQELDQAYYKAEDSAAFLAACQRLVDAIMPILRQYYKEGHPFAGYLFTSAGPADTAQKHSLIRRAVQGVLQLEQWIRYRNQTPAEQFLEMLSTIRIQISDDSTEEVPALRKQTVLYGIWYNDQIRLKDLARRFYHYIRSNSSAESLRGIWANLKQIKNVELETLLEKQKEFQQVRDDVPTWYSEHRHYNIAELPLTFPQIHFAGLEGERIITNEINKYFWEEIFYLLYARKEWAWKAYDVLANMLDKPKSKNPFITLSPDNMPHKPVEMQTQSEERICTWKASNVDFAELFCALVESKAIECEKKEDGAAALANFLGLRLDRYYSTLANVKKRDYKSRTAFLEKIEVTLRQKLQEEDE